MESYSDITRQWNNWLTFVRDEEWFEDDDEDEFVEATTEKWVKWLKSARVGFCHQLLPVLENPHTTEIRTIDVLALAVHGTTCDMLEVAGVGVADESLYRLRIDLDGLQESLNSLENHNIAVTSEDLNCAATAIAEFVSHLNDIKTLEINNCDALTMEFLAPFLACCDNVRSLILDFPYITDDEAETFLTVPKPLKMAILDHPSLQSVTMSKLRPQTVRSVSEELATIPNLTSCTLLGAWEQNGYLRLSSSEDAGAIESLLASSSLAYLKLVNISFRNEEVLTGVCDSLRNSQLKKLEVVDCIFPRTMNTEVAYALTTSESLIELDYSYCMFDSTHNTFWNDLGLALAKASSKLRSLSLWTGSDHHPASTEVCIGNLFAMLQYAHQWKITRLTVHVAEWTNDFDQALVKYIRTTPCLQDLRLVFTDRKDAARDGPLVNLSPALVEAIRSGTRTLEHIQIRTRGWERDITPQELKHHTEINRLRRVCTTKFQSPLQPEDFVQVIEVLNESILFEFLVQNEFDLQRFLAISNGLSRCSTLTLSPQASNRKRSADVARLTDLR
jgi:hypothetical protein